MKDSEEIFDLSCSTCAENGRTKEARYYCKDCAEYFCDECLKFHNRFPALRNHVITGLTGLDLETGAPVAGVKEELPRCAVHHGQTVVKFCRDHGEICCQTCIAAKHRTCKNTVEIAEAAKGVKNSPDYVSRKSALVEVIDLLSTVKNKKTMNLTELKKDEENLLQGIEKSREELIATINELAEKSKLEVTMKCADIETAINTDVSAIDAVTATMTQTLQKLTTGSEIQAFVHSRTCMTVVKEGQLLAQELTLQPESNSIRNSVNREIMDCISQFKTFLISSEIAECVKEYTASSCEKFKLFSQKCSITGVCVLDDGKILVGNHEENCLIRYDTNFKERDRVMVSGGIFALCQTGPNEVATCVGSSVKFVTFNGTLMCARDIDVGMACRGIAYIPGKKEIVLSCRSLLKVYRQDLKSFTTTIEKDNTGANIFDDAHFCTFNAAMNLLLVSDYGKGLIALNEAGQVQWVFNDPELKNPWGICILPGSCILVSGYSSNKIFQLNKTGEKIGTLVDNIHNPFSMAYDDKRSRLIVGCYSNEIYVYSLK